MAGTGVHLANTLSATTDEPIYVSSGLNSWKNGDYRQSSGNLFFTQKWAAWPLYRQGLSPPDPALQRDLQWNPALIGNVLVFSGTADPRGILAPARYMTLGLCLLGCILVWGWAAWLGGPLAGALAALLYASSPVILANGVLVTTDTGAAFWYLATLLCYAWLLRRPSPVPMAFAGFSSAMMLLSKFSIVALILGAVLLLAWDYRHRRSEYKVPSLLVWHAGACAVAWITIWTFFGWEFRPGGFAYISLEPSTGIEHLVAFLSRWRVLPEPYLREAITFEGMIKPRPAYLFGEFKMGGFWDYFPVAFLAKSTVAMLLALASLLFVRRAPQPDDERAPPAISAIAAGAAGYAIIAMLAPLNIGVRHILPLFSLAAIAGGVALARIFLQGRIPRLLAGVIALLAVAEGFSARRQPLAWFNAFAGGPMSGNRIMVDSSLEWGGDLPGLIAWEANLRKTDPASPVFVSLVGPPAHEHFGLAATNLDWALANGLVRPGYFVFGATRLVGGPAGLYGEWNQKLRDRWNASGASAWHGPLPYEVAQLGVARLAASCRAMPPTERVGPVYFVYHLDERSLERALDREKGVISNDCRPSLAPPRTGIANSSYSP
jgi:hypothetical protein